MHYETLMQRRVAKATTFIIFEKQGVTLTQLTRRLSFLSANERKALLDHVFGFCTLEQKFVSEKGAATTFVHITHTAAMAAITSAGSIKNA